ncbi:MAG: hypothetical protein L0215_21030 [Gemmataceae bacterium]|nr:hypothetical protein [Gemmataceae bacterium]
MGYPLKWALAATLIAAGSSQAPGQGKQDVPRPNLAEVRFVDGSLVRMTILQDDLEVMTKYGKLTIPIREIRRIDFGLHLPDGVGQHIDQSIKQLGSEAYRDRDEAVKHLVHYGPLAYPFLQRAARNPDPEVAQRASGLMKRITEKTPAENLRVKEDDYIQTVEFPVTGRIVHATLKAHSAHFGELSLKLSDLRTLFVRGNSADSELVVDASKYGSAPDQWFDTGVIVDPSQRLLIVCEGQVDLWPQGPGQYMASPKGYTTAGKGGNFMAGSLVGRVGENGKAFLIGERYEGAPGEEGKLYLHIVPSPWNNASTGSYRVRISMEHVALSAKR